MMETFTKHIIFQDEPVKEALKKLNDLAADAILFVVDQERHLIGSLTDGDLRRGFIGGLDFSSLLLDFIQQSPVFMFKNQYTIDELEIYKNKDYKIIPILNEQHVVIDILNFRIQKTIIPADAVIMAGGVGKRLMPLTADTPKPLLKIGGKPIVEYGIDQLIKVGIKNIYLSVNYLGEQLESYFGDGNSRNASLKYIRERQPMGTIGSILLVDNFEHDDVLVMNSDLLTNIDFADFYSSFKKSGADMAVATTSYDVHVPYAVLEVDPGNMATSLKEKPSYTYYSNAGIYFLKKEVLKMIPEGKFYDITDLIEDLLQQKGKIFTYQITGYWLDIGKPEDFSKAQEDVKHINFSL